MKITLGDFRLPLVVSVLFPELAGGNNINQSFRQDSIPSCPLPILWTTKSLQHGFALTAPFIIASISRAVLADDDFPEVWLSLSIHSPEWSI